jgi:8-oxo-dGTP pyrophosphatase MutT (NUDIX family)
VLEKQRIIHDGKVVKLALETVKLPHGTTAQFEIVHHPGGAATVAIDEQQRVCLVRQYRHAIADWMWELPAGKLDPGESPLTTAQRELVEEAGVQAKQWVSIGRMVPSPGILTENVHLFLALELTMTETSPDENESIEVQWVPFPEALARAAAGDIDDAKTIAGLFRAIPAIKKRG